MSIQTCVPLVNYPNYILKNRTSVGLFTILSLEQKFGVNYNRYLQNLRSPIKNINTTTFSHTNSVSSPVYRAAPQITYYFLMFSCFPMLPALPKSHIHFAPLFTLALVSYINKIQERRNDLGEKGSQIYVTVTVVSCEYSVTNTKSFSADHSRQ